MRLSFKTNSIGSGHRSGRAFTLIELLTVIAIIGLLAALVVNLGPGAARKKRDKLAEAQKQALMTMIDAYRDKLGSYPPSNGKIPLSGSALPAYADQYEEYTRANPLFYELIGVTMTNNNMKISVLGNFNVVNVANYTDKFGLGGVVNSDDKGKFYSLPLQPRTTNRKTDPYRPLYFEDLNDPRAGLMVFTVTASPSLTIYNTDGTTKTNYDLNCWHYDSVSTNRHNLESYDLWAVYSVGKTLYTNCNWIQ